MADLCSLSESLPLPQNGRGALTELTVPFSGGICCWLFVAVMAPLCSRDTEEPGPRWKIWPFRIFLSGMKLMWGKTEKCAATVN